MNSADQSDRRCMPIAEWPARDRQLWEAAIAPTDPFSDTGGTRASRRSLTNRNVARGYGRWLTFLAATGNLSQAADPGVRLTDAAIRAYALTLEAQGIKMSTICQRLAELREAARVMDPSGDRGEIGRLIARAYARRSGTDAKKLKLVTSDRLLDLGFRLMAEAPSKRLNHSAAIQYRDGLIIALLAMRPLRLANLTRLTLGQTLVRLNGGWLITIPPEQTKTHEHLEYVFPTDLVSALETYLDIHRPVLIARTGRWHKNVGERLWVSCDGSPLKDAQVHIRICDATEKAFGHPINPHMFRDSAATTMAIHDPKRVRLAAPLLGHRAFGTTEKFYNQARSLEAHRTFASAISAARRKDG